MTEHQESLNFADLFKRYRLRSQIDTLSRFGDLLAEDGMIYENSLFTRWQKGQRVPKDRRTLLALIRLFAKHKGITSIEEANGLLKSVGLCDLSEAEMSKLLDNHNKKMIDMVNGNHEKKITTNILKNQNIKYLRICNNLSIKEILASFSFQWLALLFIINSLWIGRINLYSLHNSFESYLWGLSYSLISLSSFFLIKKRKKTNRRLLISNNWNKASFYFRLGLLFQGIGLLLWTYYNLSGIQVPYPSAADIGYFSTAVFYLIAAQYILSANIPITEEIFRSKKLFVIAMPITIFLSIVFNYLHIFNLHFENQIRLILDFIYPITEIAALFLLMCSVLYSQFKDKSIYRSNIILLLALTSHFITEYLFVIAVKSNKYVNGGFNDFLYLASHTLMFLAILTIQPLTELWIPANNNDKVEENNPSRGNVFSLQKVRTQFSETLNAA